MSAQPLQALRFVRKTQLAPGEYRKNFRQIDADIIAAVTSPEADQVTPLMSKIYLRLVSAPNECWEREGVLYFAPRDTAGRLVKASKVLYEVLGVASATAHKALRWLHGQGIIGYSAGKNGVGIRIFLNRAASSIGVREGTAGKKILPFARGSNEPPRGSTAEPAFKDSFAVLEDLDLDTDPRAPKNGADTAMVSKTDPAPESPTRLSCVTARHNGRGAEAGLLSAGSGSAEALAKRLRYELEPCVRDAAAHAAKQIAAHEAERTRQWFETKALPKAVRVAQRETYELLRKYGGAGACVRTQANLTVGRAPSVDMPPAARPLTPEEIQETAEACVALLEMQGKAIEATLAELSPAEGGWLLPQDVARVREAAQALAHAPDEGGTIANSPQRPHSPS
jgi:hypothetical protein